MDSLARKLLEDSRLCSRGLSCKPPFLKSLSSFPSECGEAPEPMLCAACSCGSSMLGSRLAMVHGVMETVACAAVWPGHLLRPRASQPPTAQKQTSTSTGWQILATLPGFVPSRYVKLPEGAVFFHIPVKRFLAPTSYICTVLLPAARQQLRSWRHRAASIAASCMRAL